MKYLVIFLSNLILKNDMDAPLTFALGWFIAIIVVTIFQIIFIQILKKNVSHSTISKIT